MTAQLDLLAWRAPSSPDFDIDDGDLAPGQVECQEFEQARIAYDPRFPETAVRMVSAFSRFHELGYEAYFQGATAMPMAIASQALLAGMWTDGFQSARLVALTKKCDCQCSRQYHWGRGYAACPRRSVACFQKIQRLAGVMQT